MAGPSWLIDGNRFATKIKSASGTSDLQQFKWKSNPTRLCPHCQYVIDNSDVAQEWPGLPRGVKFDPTDQEIIQHLLAKAEIGDEKPHPFINEFIPSVDEEDGICYTHPRNLPGVKQDGSASHFFHRAIKAYNTGTRKRRKIQNNDSGDVRWHKTGRTKPVIWNGVQRGCKKIMVLYVGSEKGGKQEKTNWVMHQYHLGTEEDEKDGEYVISKVFYQQQQVKPNDKSVGDIPEVTDDVHHVVAKVDPATPNAVIPNPPRNEKRIDSSKEIMLSCINSAEKDHDMGFVDEMRQPEASKSSDEDHAVSENNIDQGVDHDDNQAGEENKWWESESQYILDSQQLVEALSLCDDLLQSQSPKRVGDANVGEKKTSILSEYARLGPEDLKKDLEECQNLVLDPAKLELDTPPDFRLSQLEFGSQESYLAWGGARSSTKEGDTISNFLDNHELE